MKGLQPDEDWHIGGPSFPEILHTADGRSFWFSSGLDIDGGRFTQYVVNAHPLI